jgi:hypothetical protein
MRHIGALVGMGVLILAWVFSLVPTAPSLAQPQPDNAAQLRELAERALESPYGYPMSSMPPGSQEEPRVELLVSQLPTDPPLDVPVPPGGRLLGSIVRHGYGPYSMGSGGMAQVIVDAPGSPQEAIAFYERALAERGWSSGSSRMGSSAGFQQTLGPATAYFCRDDDATLSIQAQPRTGRAVMTGVQASFMGSSPPCLNPGSPSGATSYYDRSGMTTLYQSLPTLYPPEGVTIRQTGGYGGSMGSYGMEARATTNRGAADLEAFFSQQLVEKGWRRQSGQASGPITWSAWAVPELEGYHGFLSVRELPGTDQRILGIRIDSEADESSGSGGSYGYPYYTGPMPASPASPPNTGPFEGE